MLYKCHMLPDSCPKIIETHPNLKIKILSMSGYQSRSELFKTLETEFNLFEEIYNAVF
ncbi:hypothetical protein GKC96_03925 [Lactobacillus ruminis]|nr:hypothetical protein [Ligilactobacillus ruminis]MSB55911.1 hypothetical protein [Ligilactobacillus ruminis]